MKRYLVGCIPQLPQYNGSIQNFRTYYTKLTFNEKSQLNRQLFNKWYLDFINKLNENHYASKIRKIKQDYRGDYPADVSDEEFRQKLQDTFIDVDRFGTYIESAIDEIENPSPPEAEAPLEENLDPAAALPPPGAAPEVAHPYVSVSEIRVEELPEEEGEDVIEYVNVGYPESEEDEEEQGDNDEDFIRALAASLAEPSAVFRPAPAQRASEEDQELQAALEASEALARQEAAQKEQREEQEMQSALAESRRAMNAVPFAPEIAMPKRQPASEVPSIYERLQNDSLNREALDNYYQEKTSDYTAHKLHPGDIFHSNQQEKYNIANSIRAHLSDSSISDTKKLVLVRKAIRDNRKYTGSVLLHGEGKLHKALTQIETQLLHKVEKRPYQKSLAQLESYINVVQELEKNRALSGGLKVGSFMIKSNQIKKKRIALIAFGLTKILNEQPTKAQLETLKAELLELMGQNDKLTVGSNPFHLKGTLHEILENLHNEISANLETHLPNRNSNKQN